MDGMGDFEGEFEHATWCTQLTHVCAREEVTLEVKCCGSWFDKNLTSSRLAESPPPKDTSAGHRHEQSPETILTCREWAAQCMPVPGLRKPEPKLDSSRVRAGAGLQP
jgi:hypothetical protein